MRVLVTGATGFVGRRLCEVLSGSGCRVTALSRRPDAARQTVPSLSQVYAWRPVEEAPPLESLQQVDAVIHLAGESVVGRWNARKRRAIRESRVRSTRNLVDAMRQAKARPRSLISASAIGYYGRSGRDGVDRVDAGCRRLPGGGLWPVGARGRSRVGGGRPRGPSPHRHRPGRRRRSPGRHAAAGAAGDWVAPWVRAASGGPGFTGRI